MPWKETEPMEQRMIFITRWLQDAASISELCRQFGISRKTGHKWIDRYRERGPEGLTELSRAPHHRPHAVSGELLDRILALRAERPTWGPRKLRQRLDRIEPDVAWPAPSTIGELLKARGLTVPRRRRRKASPDASPLASVDRVNQIWCTDFKGWVILADHRRLTPLTITDAHSRLIIRCQGLDGRTGFEQVQPIFDAAFRQYGLPMKMRSDNGAPFASTGLGGLSRLAVWWMKLGIQPERIEPGKPQQNGRHERMHRTLKAETMQPCARGVRKQQLRFDNFVREFNEERPHEALDGATPIDLYAPSPRSYPCPLIEAAYPHGWMVRKVWDGGRIKWGGKKMHVCNALEGEYIGLEPTDDGMWKIYFLDRPLGLFDERQMRVIALTEGRRPPTLSQTPRAKVMRKELKT